MFVIRQAILDDAPTLLKLAKMVHFINLPPDPDIITAKITQSRYSFRGKPKAPEKRQFMFVLEDTDTGNVIGTSSIVSRISWPGWPQLYLQVRKRELYSEELQSGQVHLTLQLGRDESGPSELAGLILSPSYRGHKERLGRLLSLVRFHFIGLHREWFSERIMAEMMGALTPDTRNLLWNYLGRRFINLNYAEADGFSHQSKEFITSLFPEGEIYASLLPAEARALIGKVGEETEPAKAMLERMGFEYNGRVDPFDGGPYLEARVEDIPLVQATRSLPWTEATLDDAPSGFVSAWDHDSGFRAAGTPTMVSDDKVAIPADVAELIGAQPGATVGVTPDVRAHTAGQPTLAETKPAKAAT